MIAVGDRSSLYILVSGGKTIAVWVGGAIFPIMCKLKLKPEYFQIDSGKVSLVQ